MGVGCVCAPFQDYMYLVCTILVVTILIKKKHNTHYHHHTYYVYNTCAVYNCKSIKIYIMKVFFVLFRWNICMFSLFETRKNS